MIDSNPNQPPVIWLCHGPDHEHSDRETPAAETPAWLSEEERQRLATLSGLTFREFLSSRWLIRHALSQVSDIPWQDCQSVAGRPVASAHPAGWSLSLSHSHGLSGCAISAKEGLGLDLEPLKRRPNWQKVVRRWFTLSEQDWLLDRDSAEDFLKVWTLKEAWLKATGRGIANNLKTLEVDQDFNLTGDCTDTVWQASLGEVNQTLITVVNRASGESSPSGFLMETPDIYNKPGDTPAIRESINWLLHRTITPFGDIDFQKETHD